MLLLCTSLLCKVILCTGDTGLECQSTLKTLKMLYALQHPALSQGLVLCVKKINIASISLVCNLLYFLMNSKICAYQRIVWFVYFHSPTQGHVKIPYLGACKNFSVKKKSWVQKFEKPWFRQEKGGKGVEKLGLLCSPILMNLSPEWAWLSGLSQGKERGAWIRAPCSLGTVEINVMSLKVTNISYFLFFYYKTN